MLKRMLSIILVVCIMGAMLLSAGTVRAFAAETYTTGQYIISEKVGVYLRNGPGTNYRKIGAVPHNTRVEVVVVSGDWGKICYRGKVGWVCLRYAQYLNSADEYTVGEHLITERLGVYLRTGPGTNYRKIGAVPNNTLVEVVAVSGDWGKICYRGKVGWVCLRYATKQNSHSPETEMTQNPYVAAGLQAQVNQLMQLYEPGSRKYYFSKANAYQCHGFACEALMLFWKTEKPTPTNSRYTYYKATASKSYVDKIRPGDMVRYRIGNYDHTIVITNVDDEYVYYADCNSDLNGTIEYNKRMSKDELASLLTKKLIDKAVSTRGYICHYKYNDL